MDHLDSHICVLRLWFPRHHRFICVHLQPVAPPILRRYLGISALSPVFLNTISQDPRQRIRLDQLSHAGHACDIFSLVSEQQYFSSPSRCVAVNAQVQTCKCFLVTKLPPAVFFEIPCRTNRLGRFHVPQRHCFVMTSLETVPRLFLRPAASRSPLFDILNATCASSSGGLFAIWCVVLVSVLGTCGIIVLGLASSSEGSASESGHNIKRTSGLLKCTFVVLSTSMRCSLQRRRHDKRPSSVVNDCIDPPGTGTIRPWCAWGYLQDQCDHHTSSYRPARQQTQYLLCVPANDVHWFTWVFRVGLRGSLLDRGHRLSALEGVLLWRSSLQLARLATTPHDSVRPG